MGGRNCLKYLKKGQSRKEGRENKNLKKKGGGGGKLGQGVDALKRRGGWACNRIRNYVHICSAKLAYFLMNIKKPEVHVIIGS